MDCVIDYIRRFLQFFCKFCSKNDRKSNKFTHKTTKTRKNKSVNLVRRKRFHIFAASLTNLKIPFNIT